MISINSGPEVGWGIFWVIFNLFSKPFEICVGFPIKYDPGPEVGGGIFWVIFNLFSKPFEICVGFPIKYDPGPEVLRFWGGKNPRFWYS